MDRIAQRVVVGKDEVGVPVSFTRVVAAAGMGASVCGGVFVVVAKDLGWSLVMAVLGGAMLGVGVFASVARLRFVDDSPYEDEESGALTDLESEEPDASVFASYLIEHLGADLTAYLAGADEPDQVERWASGELAPGPLPLARLRSGYEAAGYLVRAYDGETAQSWFSGMNPWLDDEAPAYVLRHTNEPEVWESVVEAAEDFVEFER